MHRHNGLTAVYNLLAKPCSEGGRFLPADTAPQQELPNENDWSPFTGRVQFETAELLYLKTEMSQNDINKLMDLWGASFMQAGSDARPPFADYRHMHTLIDNIKHGDVPWHSFKIHYSGEIPEQNAPKWMTDEYEVCVRDTNQVVANLLQNTDFDGEFDYVCYKEFDARGRRRFCNYFSGELAEKLSVILFYFIN